MSDSPGTSTQQPTFRKEDWTPAQLEDLRRTEAWTVYYTCCGFCRHEQKVDSRKFEDRYNKEYQFYEMVQEVKCKACGAELEVVKPEVEDR